MPLWRSKQFRQANAHAPSMAREVMGHLPKPENRLTTRFVPRIS
jgi:hypothetical protein